MDPTTCDYLSRLTTVVLFYVLEVGVYREI